ncbi:hypothetical protein BKA63DRAFT_495496 [Paraphoma chrysanthemicola]|nr:hypothetical protein BKA63DRAFT_495496 [Paraphoma chrysanthemicola]
MVRATTTQPLPTLSVKKPFKYLSSSSSSSSILFLYTYFLLSILLEALSVVLLKCFLLVESNSSYSSLSFIKICINLEEVICILYIMKADKTLEGYFKNLLRQQKIRSKLKSRK